MEKESRVLACYSTQSGTSRRLADKFCSDFNRLTGLSNLCLAENISSFETQESIKLLLNYDLVIFFISSYGQGEPCDDALKFYDTIKRNNISELQRYSIFGCGNSYYDKYQAAAIELKYILDMYHIEQIGEFGKGDEAQNSIMDDYESWCFDYMNIFSKVLKVKLTDVPDYYPSYQVVNITDNKSSTFISKNLYKEKFHQQKPFATEINIDSIKRYGSHYIHFDINLHSLESGLKFQTGDHVGIYPINSKDDVDEIIDILGITSNDPFKIIPMNRMNSNEWIGKIYGSYQELLTNDVEINGVLSREIIKDLLNYFIKESSINIRNELMKVIESRSTFNERILNQQITFTGLFKLFCIERGRDYDNIPISFILENFGPLKPRLFSITNSNSSQRDCVSVVMKFVKNFDNSFIGVCSHTIEDICINGKLDNKISIYISKSKFKLPFDLSRPLIFIGSGTGIAPFRGFLQEICSSNYKLKQVNKIIVYFGLRDSNNDFIYSESFKEFQSILGDKLDLRIAISGNDENKYVQDLIKEDSEVIVKNVIENRGYVYVCGDAGGMSKGVKKVIIDIIGDAQGDIKSGDNYVQYMQSMGRYKEDVW